ncbi:16S rRNA (guanine(966)-N(2))-methyltransferase RsmD [Brevibacterium jeotgali]|uniref:16S rRNA (Guanine966-N2)-methyltransferase n=1 Tax=Brevibacterium jeotgali TaxID=1262550 RepID=A0A2H1L4C3_9MICO|nr:16S rRNA (guanine(966)-N(2))-methyltransferase RsmD [Brevibacterium jeotgali]TWC02461.1 16S rRNA (guanine966-N2)-methyltransferase [Brevibacterium jeotgali]SMY11253.1 16S rRNA (guanine966-N2)-methyltransferase [Brevibacterium jeotgali]
MRIIAGRHRGRPLHAPKGRDTRPTPDRVRESLFASLEGMGVLEGARVLDLFAGSGSLGLEALSRGAHDVVFVDQASGSVGALARSIAELGEGSSTKVLSQRAQTAVDRLLEEDQRFDVVFADPPYPMAELELGRLLVSIGELLSDLSALAIVERSVRSPQPTLPDRLELYRDRTYGETRMWLLQLVGEDEAEGCSVEHG